MPATEAELEQALAQESDPAPAAEDSEEEPRSLRPGQKGFAQRLMAKYGWTKGRGLGADGSGIVNPLQVKVEKRKKKSDAEGGGFRDPGGRGTIIGGQRNAEGKTEGKFGAMSEVVLLKGMVDGMDLDEEVGDGGLMQEIGEECSEKVSAVVPVVRRSSLISRPSSMAASRGSTSLETSPRRPCTSSSQVSCRV